MKAELRADGLHISGYVNVPGRESRPIRSPRGKFVEIIEQGAFQRAINKAPGIRLLLDHNKQRVLSSTNGKTLSLKEDNVGLRADTVITDEEVIAEAKAGHLRGWSFGMRNIVDKFEERGEGMLPLRRVSDFDMDEITLVLNKVPVYQSTSIELRAEDEEEVTEYRAEIEEVTVEIEEGKKQEENLLSGYKERLSKI